MTKGGNCYEYAFNALFSGAHDDLIAEENPLGEMRLVLVHGFPKLTKDCGEHKAGTKFGHAWLEQVVKLANGSDCVMLVVDCGSKHSERSLVPQFIYYEAGNIDPEECRRYEREEAYEMAIMHGHYGDWLPEDEIPEGVVYGNE